MKADFFIGNTIGIGINVKLINGSLRLLRNALDKAKEANFDVVELPLHGLDVIIGGRIRDKRLKEIKNILKDYPFCYSVHCPESLNLMNLEELKMEKAILKSSIEFSYEIGSHILVYHPGRYKSESKILLRKQERLNQKELGRLKKIEQDILKNFSSTLKEANVFLCMENARPFIGEKEYTYADDIEELVEQVNEIDSENIRINLDFGHAYLSANYYNKDFLKTISKVNPYVKHFHLHDNFGHPCFFQEKDQNLLIVNGRGDMHMPLGWGDIPFQEAIKILNSDGCFFVIEIRPRYFEYMTESKQLIESLITDCVITLTKN